MATKKESTAQDGELFDSQSKLKLDKTHDVLDRPEKFAKLFCDVARKQVDMQTFLKEVMRELIATDPKARDSLLGLIRQAMKEDWKSWLRSRGGMVIFGIWTLITIAFGAWISSLFT